MSNEDNRIVAKLHVSSEHRGDDQLHDHEDNSEFSFKLPPGLNYLKKVCICDAEITHAQFPIDSNNNQIYFNEYSAVVKYKGKEFDYVDITVDPVLEYSTTMYTATLPPFNYDINSFVEAIRVAMNTPTLVYSSDGSVYKNKQNTYNVIRQPNSNWLKLLFTATPFEGDYALQNQVYDSNNNHKIDFSIRHGNLPDRWISANSAIFNPYGANHLVSFNPYGPVSQVGINFYRAHIRHSLHCSQFRVVMQLEKAHRFIPGDPIKLECDQFNEKGLVVYVNGDECHVFLEAFSTTRQILTNCRIRISEVVNQKSCAELGISKKNRQGLLVSVRIDHESYLIPYSVKIYANASQRYDDFNIRNNIINPFKSGGNQRAISYVHDGFGVDESNGEGNFFLTEGSGRSAVQLDSCHLLLNSSLVYFSNQMGNESLILIVNGEKKIFVDKSLNSQLVPRIGFHNYQLVENNDGLYDNISEVGPPIDIGKIIETYRYRFTNNERFIFHIGKPDIMSTNNIDMSRGMRVVFFELDVAGHGPVGNIFTTYSDRRFLGRTQMAGGPLSVTLQDNQVKVGEYEFQHYVNPHRLTLRLYDENGRLYKTNGMHFSCLLKFEGVTSYNQCKKVYNQCN
jgi:hypothetical protein